MPQKEIENTIDASSKLADAIEKLKATRSKQETFDASIKACEELRKIIDARIQQLKQTQPEALRTVVQARVDQLEKQVLSEKEKEHLLREQINALKRLLADVKGYAAKSKKASPSEALNSAILQLRKEAVAEGEKVKLIQEQIARLETLSGEPRKSSATAKRKKG